MDFKDRFGAIVWYKSQLDANFDVHVSMVEIYPTITQCAIVATAFKVLLFPA